MMVDTNHMDHNLISHQNTLRKGSIANYREDKGRFSASPFVLGTVIIAISIYFGKANTAVSVIILAISFVATALWQNSPYPWIFLVSMLVANPVNSSLIFSSSIIFAFALMVFRPRYIWGLERWIYLPAIVAVIAFGCSALNWMSGDMVSSLLRQVAYSSNYLMGPLFLFPIIYFRLGQNRDSVTHLKGLLFYLIIPSTLMLYLAHKFGTPMLYRQTDINAEDRLLGGLLTYRIGNTTVDFLRTHVGFILSSLICASVAIVVSRVKMIYRLFAAGSLALNSLFLIFTFSIGSTVACLCGLAAMLLVQLRAVNVIRYLVSIIVLVAIILLVWRLSPGVVKKYVDKHYKNRFESHKGLNIDRYYLWQAAINSLAKHPAGVGWTLAVGKSKKISSHNDYLVYAVSYGIMGGMAYAYLVLRLLIYFYRKSRRMTKEPYAIAVTFAGLGVTVVACVNSMTDHMIASKWYFTAIWSIIWYCYFSSRSDGPYSLKADKKSEYK
jgi:hypothetical protein